MAQSVGSLFVDLKLNQAEFLAGLKTAGSQAQRAGRDIGSAFTKLGALETVAMAPLNALGAQFGVFATLAAKSMGTAVGAVLALPKALEKAQGGFGVLGTLVGSTGKVVTGLGIAAIGAGAAITALALHTTEEIAKLGSLSQSTGVSTEALSGFQFVAKQAGVSAEAMTTSLERMSKTAFAAATAPAGTVTAYSRLGISVREAGGAFKPTTELMEELAEKFAAMPDGVAKTALAMQLFGRGGAEIIPVLNQGREGIEQWIAAAQRAGIVISSQTAQAAERFEQTLNVMKADFEGISLQLTTRLLPAMQTVASMLSEGLADKTSAISGLVDEMEKFGMVLLTVGNAAWTATKMVGQFVGDLAALIAEGTADMATDVRDAAIDMVDPFHWRQSEADFRDHAARLKGIYDQFKTDMKGDVSDFSRFQDGMAGAFIPNQGPQRPPGGTFTPNVSRTGTNLYAGIERIVGELKAQTSAELALAGAAGESAAAQRLQAAAGDAQRIIAQLTAEAMTKEGTQRALLLARINSETDAIRILTAEKTVAADAVALNNSLTEETRKFAATAEGIRQLAAAYGSGAAAIAGAQIDRKLDEDREKVAQLEEEYALLAQQHGVSADALLKLQSAINAANASLETHRRQLQAIQSAELDVTIGKETFAFGAQVAALRALGNAYLEGADKVREAQVALKTAQFGAEHPEASGDQLAKIGALYQRQSRAEFESAIQQAAAEYDLNLQYADRIQKLERIREALQGVGASTLTVDAAEKTTTQEIITQWDDAALKVGTFGQRVQAVMNQVVIDGQNSAAKIAEAFRTALDGVNDQLAKLLTGQKVNFGQIATQLGQSLIKAGLQNIEGSVIGKLFPGAKTGTPGSSAGNPMFVQVVNSTGLPGLGTSPSSSGILGTLGKLIPGLGSISSGAAAGGAGGFFSSIASFFGGFLAEGGDVTPGKAYIVGEKHPEFFVPGRSGSIVPTLHTGSTSHTSISMNISGVKDADTFRRSQPQISQQMHREAAVAERRNGR